MITTMGYRKCVIYALHRRITGGPRTKSDIDAGKRYNTMTLVEACEDVINTYSTEDKKRPGVSNLSRNHVPKSELAPSVYATHVGLSLFVVV